ncbi:MAG: spore germination protein [Paenibacillaceae bacterium]|nr:spore germination protein [Paenibacillaceae bacterium]
MFFRFFRNKRRLPFTREDASPVAEPEEQPVEQTELTADLDRNERILRDIFRNSYDIVFRSLHVGGRLEPLLIIYAAGLVDTNRLDEALLQPLVCRMADTNGNGAGGEMDELIVASGETERMHSIPVIVQHVLQGNVAILTDGCSDAMLVTMQGWTNRGIEEPSSEPAIRGPREGFIEDLLTNTSMLRRRLRTPRLKLEHCTIGEVSHTGVVIAYIDGIATESVVEEVRRRVERIEIDGILDSGYIEQFIEDSPYSPFPQVLNTERPDVTAGQLLEGRVAIFADGSSFVLIAPMTMWSAMQSGEEYYERVLIGTAVRCLRFIFLLIALLFPSLYIAITTFHQEMLPNGLLLSIAAAREKSPFPALIEALLMEITFEALREAGIRLPKQVGSAISIVGVLVIGESAVRAGIVSAPLVIIVSITGIASFTIPRYSFGIAIRMLRFPIMLLSGTLGLYGIVLGTVAILFHLTELRSFGVPYLAPVAPLVPRDLKDVFIRAPLWSMKFRPRYIGHKNSQRVSRRERR